MPTGFSSVDPGSAQPLSLVPQTDPTAGRAQPAGEAAQAGESLRADAPHPSGGLHRVAQVRHQQGVSLRTISRRTGVEVKELRRQEDPGTDLLLSTLRMWQSALDVPLIDLLEDESQTLSRPVKERAKLVRIMKTVVSLCEACEGNVRLERLSRMLREQLVELMPELSEIGGWPQCGTRRGADVLGRIVHEPISVDLDSGE
jgi:hypothetical protein